MRKLLIALLLILAVSTVCIYLFIPKKVSVSQVETVNVGDRWVFGYVMDKAGWKNWWPVTATGTTDSSFVYNGLSFSIDSLFYNAMKIKIKRGETLITESRLYVIHLGNNQSQVNWEATIEPALNPVTRLKNYQSGVVIRQSMQSLLSAYKNWLSVTENVYGFKILQGKILDTMLLAKRAQFKNNPPSPLQVDSLLQILRDYTGKYHAAQNGLPMLHVVNNEPGIYEAQVALPINKKIPETNEIKIKRMFAGNTLTARFKGGPYTIQRAYDATENYKLDHLKSSPAIPFQSMITDRAKEADTSKWETILYYPVVK